MMMSHCYRRCRVMMMSFWCIGCLLLAGCVLDRNRQASEGESLSDATSSSVVVPTSPNNVLSPSPAFVIDTAVPSGGSEELQALVTDTVEPLVGSEEPQVPIIDTAVPTLAPEQPQLPIIDTAVPTLAPQQPQVSGINTAVPTLAFEQPQVPIIDTAVPTLAPQQPQVTAPVTKTSVTANVDPTLLPDIPQSAYQIFLPGIFNAAEPARADDHQELDLTAVPTQDEGIAEIVVYDDTLDPNWSMQQSYGIDLNMASTAYVYNGSVAAAITPQVEYGQFFLHVRNDAAVAYTYDKILGVSFYVSGGANIIENDDLVVTVLGSNAFTYWVPNDTSVQVDREVTEELPLFSETRLYFLGINQSIPANTWTEVIVWLDDLQFDPIYQYITGIYLKNDEDFLQTYYIDRVSLLFDQSEGVQ